jgi:2-dehydro-3-deoxyphosphogluconate aldolase/(4S)-4-hydroxy-2-oxoglutarate aldolase
MNAAMQARQEKIETILRRAPVVPVVIVHELAHAVPLARALVAGGLPAVEITLRTPVALDAIRAIAAEVDGVEVGAGTVLNAADLYAAERAGARFAVSPGHSPALLDAADDSDLPYLPGASTASEAMTLLERGYRWQKFFPAVPAGGIEFVRALASPLPQVGFCTTGGIGAASAAAWLALPNVVAVGGSWLTPKELVAAGNWAAVEALAREAAALRS